MAFVREPHPMDYFLQRDNIENSQSEHSDGEKFEQRSNRESAKSSDSRQTDVPVSAQ